MTYPNILEYIVSTNIGSNTLASIVTRDHYTYQGRSYHICIFHNTSVCTYKASASLQFSLALSLLDMHYGTSYGL